MNRRFLARPARSLLAGLVLLSAGGTDAHEWAGSLAHPPGLHSTRPPAAFVPSWFLAQAEPGTSPVPTSSPSSAKVPAQAEAFSAFSPEVRVRSDDRFLYVESQGLPLHPMMIGITAWQQQVPLPQNYTGANSWRFPLVPIPAAQPMPIRDHFLRGAIAIAANGIPIFNPQNNRGEISAEIGELDQWGGHCGRADDYHYHAAPLHLQSVLGPKLPIAFALDGYAIYGLKEPDGTTPSGLDAFNGHTTDALGYHYHASTRYPYVNGGFHGTVAELEGQVDPQPRAQPVRPSLTALRGARITGFEASGTNRFLLRYEVSGQLRTVSYSVNSDGTYPFEFQDGQGGTVKQIYTRREGGGQAPGARRPEGNRVRPRPPSEPPVATESRARPQSGTGSTTPASWDALKRPSPTFILSSPVLPADGNLPTEFTGEGEGSTPPLVWKGAPSDTQSYALIMDHLAPGNEVKSYWTVWNIPAAVTELPKNATGGGQMGISSRGKRGYEPPHSQGPGPKTYVLTVYALTEPLTLSLPAGEVTREILLGAMQGKVLASASLPVRYTRQSTGGDQRKTRNRSGESSPASPNQKDAPATASPANAPGREWIKPTAADTTRINVYADNWFSLYLNGELVAVDSISFLPHNVVSVDILPEYPLTIAVLAKDNADPQTGLEYGNHIGDGGFILKFADGTLSNAQWKAKSFFRGPLDRDITHPRVEHTPLPDRWWAVDFDDRNWDQATEFTEAQVNPKASFREADFSGAKFIWSSDLDLDNTVIFRAKIEKPGWSKRWNTHSELNLTGAPEQ